MEWGKEISFSERKLFLGLIRPLDHLQQTGESQRDTYLVQIQSIQEILQILGFTGIWDTDRVFTKEDVVKLENTQFMRDHSYYRKIFGLTSTQTFTGGTVHKQYIAALKAVFRRCGVTLNSKKGKRTGTTKTYTYSLDQTSVEKMLELCQIHLNRSENDGKILCVKEVEELLYRPLVHYDKYTRLRSVDAAAE